jgi:hypothetical protein
MLGLSHPSPEALARLVTGTAEPDELRQVLLPHLLDLCPKCRGVRNGLTTLARDFGHWDVSVALAEEPAALALYSRIEHLAFPDQLAAVTAGEDFHTWGVCRLLQQRSRDQATSSPRTATRLAQLAIAVSASLGEAYDPAWTRGMRALCLASLGDARRARGELEAASDNFAQAQHLVGAGIGNQGVEAEVLLLAGLCERDRHELPAAERLFGDAATLYTSPDPDVADLHLAAVSRAHHGWCRYHQGAVREAQVLLAEALPRLDPARDRQTLLDVHQGRIWAALALGCPDVAALLSPACELAAEAADQVAGARLRRAAARLARVEGKPGPAEQALREAIGAFLAIDEGIDAALAFFDLADLFVCDAAATVASLADDLLPVFSDASLNRIQIVSLLLFQQACAQEGKLTHELIVQLARVLEQNRRPSLSWWSGFDTLLTPSSEEARP